MIKIRVKDNTESKPRVIPVPYTALGMIFGKADISESGEAVPGALGKTIIKELKQFAKKNPGFVFIEVKDSDGSEVTITL